MSVNVDPDFNPVPSLTSPTFVTVSDQSSDAPTIVFVADDEHLPDIDGLSKDFSGALAAAGFTAKANQTFIVPGKSFSVLTGLPEGATLDQVREAAAAAALALRKAPAIQVDLRGVSTELSTDDLVLAVTEGILLARYSYTPLQADAEVVILDDLHLWVAEGDVATASAAASMARILARTTNLARDLANTPPRHLNAVDLARVAEQIGPEFGLEVEISGPEQLEEMKMGGLLGTNAGSTEEARLIKVMYRPENSSTHLALVGKGITYDSGGISLKPSDPMHALMKFDMSGAAAVLAAMTALADLEVKGAVTAWLMATDNMPSGSATKLGEVLTIRGGKTVEVKNTDAEGRLVLADGLVLATEESPRADAIVDIATLTGAALMALGSRNAALFANNRDLAAQVEAAAALTGETVWELPLDERLRKQLKSNVADLQNIGGRFGGAIFAALFLSEFVQDRPWAHLDIAGTMHSETDDFWRVVGSTGFGARLLTRLAQDFTAPEEPEV